ncbi:type I methionyl aminopeptidase [soil metagenome]
MSICSPADLEGMTAVGWIVAEALRATARHVRPGVTTAELDRIGGDVLRRHGARSAPRLVYHFPAWICVSVNDEAVHGIPGPRVIAPGDLVKIDVTAELGGYMADAARTVIALPAPARAFELALCARRAFREAMKVARAGRLIRDIGQVIEAEVRGQGFFVLKELAGHGIGRSIHEEPAIPNFWTEDTGILKEGMVITVEPIISVGNCSSVLDADGWTIRTADRSRSAHFEETIVITEGEPILLTAA